MMDINNIINSMNNKLMAQSNVAVITDDVHRFLLLYSCSRELSDSSTGSVLLLIAVLVIIVRICYSNKYNYNFFTL